MNITPGIFKDSPNKAETQKILPGNERPKSSFSSSLELLTPELVNKTRPRSVESSRQQNSATFSSNDSDITNLNKDALLKNLESMKKETENNEKMRKAIQKMKKLEKILFEKVKKEKQVKLQRLQYERNILADMAQLKSQSSEGATSSADVVNNTAKYLALMPPLQQLEVLIERCESAQEFVEPIFQTQFLDEEGGKKAEENLGSKSVPSSEKNDLKKSKKKSDANSNTQDDEDQKTNFIKRNIELVKDAGNLILMTPEEKSRLSELLKDLDAEKETLEENEETNNLVVDVNSINVGFRPGSNELNRLREINQQLSSLSCDTTRSDVGFQLSSTHSGLQNQGDTSTTDEAKSTLAEIFNSEKINDEIEKRLNQLDSEWKEKLDNKEPKLDDVTLSRLLSQYAPSLLSSRTSILSASNNDLDEIEQEQAGDDELMSVSTCQLSRSKLDQLLCEARTCLGLPPPPSLEDDMLEDDTDLCIQSIDTSTSHESLGSTDLKVDVSSDSTSLYVDR